MKQIYASCGAMVISSLWETTPITLLEAWACRLPVISTNTGILQDRMGPDSAAYVVPREDATALAGAMDRVMLDFELAARMAAHGYDEVAANYTLDTVYRTAARIYREAIQ